MIVKKTFLRVVTSTGKQGNMREVFPVVEFNNFTRKSGKSQEKLYQKIKKVFYMVSIKVIVIIHIFLKNKLYI